MKHQETHAAFIDGCFACHIAGVSFSALATPNRSAGTVDVLQRDHSFAVDSAAYRRLRKNGTQPKSVAGSAVLERHANTLTQVQGDVKRLKR